MFAVMMLKVLQYLLAEYLARSLRESVGKARGAVCARPIGPEALAADAIAAASLRLSRWNFLWLYINGLFRCVPSFSSIAHGDAGWRWLS